MTMVNGMRSPPRRVERAASAAKQSCFNHCAYTSGSVVAGSYRSGNSDMERGAEASAKRERHQIRIFASASERNLNEPHRCGSSWTGGERGTAKGDWYRRS